MRTQTVIAVILIALALVAFTYQGITYTTRDKKIDLGPLQVTKETTHNIPIPPIAAAIALIGGIALLVMDGKRLKVTG